MLKLLCVSGATVKVQLPLSGTCVWLHIPSECPDVVGLWLGTQNFERIAAVGVVGFGDGIANGNSKFLKGSGMLS